MTKQKSLKENLRVDYYLLLKCSKKQCTLLPLPGPNHLQLKFNTRMQDVKRILDLNCKKKEHQTISSIQLPFKFQKFSAFKWL